MKKIIMILLLSIAFYLPFTLQTQSLNVVCAESVQSISIVEAITILAVSNDSPDDESDYTVTVSGKIKNETTLSINNIVIILDVKTAWLGVTGVLQLTIPGTIAAGATYTIIMSGDFAEKFAKVEKISVRINNGTAFEITNPEISSPSDDLNLEIADMNPWISLSIICGFALLFCIAIPKEFHQAEEREKARVYKEVPKTYMTGRTSHNHTTEQLAELETERLARIESYEQYQKQRRKNNEQII
ncbi:MAG: hypothetical protein PHO33_04495 [Clostridia bacterium]|nr:hypothetical protein [Clostridia bacterium]